MNYSFSFANSESNTKRQQSRENKHSGRMDQRAAHSGFSKSHQASLLKIKKESSLSVDKYPAEQRVIQVINDPSAHLSFFINNHKSTNQ